MFDRLIRFAARYDPQAIAAIGAGGHVTYAELDRTIDRTAAELSLTFAPGSTEVVGVAVTDVYLQLLIILGCARIGVPTASLFPGMVPQMAALAGAGRIIADDPAFSPEVLADAGWSGRVFAADAKPPAVAIDPDAVGRVHFSSGTTGMPKACALSWALLDRRIAHTWNFVGGLDRITSLVGPESGALQTFLTTWAKAGCILFGDRDPRILVRQLQEWRPTGIQGTPSQIDALLGALPDRAPLIGGIVALVGGRAEAGLRERVARQLGARILIGYGSTEAGLSAVGLAAADAPPGGVGTITPWTEVMVVDEAGAEAGVGETGRIRLRGPDVVAGYLGEAPFADGWFDTGDLGSISADGELVILGRVDEVMNLGGRKLAPEALEELVRAVPGVRDVAAFALADAHGIEQPWLAIVRGEELDESAIGGAITIPELPPVRIAWIETIPRTAIGKVQRDRLREAAARLPEAS